MTPNLINADDIVPIRMPAKALYMVLTDEVSAHYDLSPVMMKNLLKHESGYNQNAVGDHGLAHGVPQYHKDEFNYYSSLYLKYTGVQLQYISSSDQIELMAWQFKNYPKSRHDWGTYRRLYEKKH